MIIRVVHPKMKKYLEDHPYMEPDGMQERKEASKKKTIRLRKAKK